MDRRVLLGSLAALALALSACQGAAPAPGATGERAPASPVVAEPHPTLAEHAFMPKRLEAMVQIDMHEMYFANPEGEKNPTFRLPVGKTVGIHLHNEGALVHELAIGRGRATDGEYEVVLTEQVPMDVFFYYGEVKAELEGATFGELEVDQGIKNTWLRAKFGEESRGEWEIGCFVEGHYEAGMHAKLIIE